MVKLRLSDNKLNFLFDLVGLVKTLEAAHVLGSIEEGVPSLTDRGRRTSFSIFSGFFPQYLYSMSSLAFVWDNALLMVSQFHFVLFLESLILTLLRSAGYDDETFPLMYRLTWKVLFCVTQPTCQHMLHYTVHDAVPLQDVLLNLCLALHFLMQEADFCILLMLALRLQETDQPVINY